MQTIRLKRPSPREARSRALFHSRGFTLVELVIVLVIMGIVAAIAAPRYAEAVGRQRADGAAQRVVSDIAYARALARTTSASVSITFRPGGTYGIASAPDPLNRAAGGAYAVDLSSSPYSGSILGGGAAPPAGAVTAGVSSFAFTFDGYGEPSAIGYVVIRCGRTNRQVTLDQGGVATITKPSDASVQTMLPGVVLQ